MTSLATSRDSLEIWAEPLPSKPLGRMAVYIGNAPPIEISHRHAIVIMTSGDKVRVYVRPREKIGQRISMQGMEP